jgi:hypothetical protein
MTYRNKKLLASAQGKDCQLRIPGVCNGNPETVVWCHLNGQEYGKGMGHKSHDLFGFYGCSNCHDLYDGRLKFTGAKFDEWARDACLASLRIACDEGVI